MTSLFDATLEVQHEIKKATETVQQLLKRATFNHSTLFAKANDSGENHKKALASLEPLVSCATDILNILSAKTTASIATGDFSDKVLAIQPKVAFSKSMTDELKKDFLNAVAPSARMSIAKS